jgi:hypothetical protein
VNRGNILLLRVLRKVSPGLRVRIVLNENLCDELKIEILRYLNNEFRRSEIIVGSAWKNQATLIGIARPREIMGLNCILKSSESEQSKPFQEHSSDGICWLSQSGDCIIGDESLA